MISLAIFLIATSIAGAATTDSCQAAPAIAAGARNLRQNGQHLLAATQFATAAALACDPAEKDLMQYEYAWELYALQEKSESRRVLREILAKPPGPNQRLYALTANLFGVSEAKLEPSDVRRMELWKSRAEPEIMQKKLSEMGEKTPNDVHLVALSLQPVALKKPWLAGVSSAVIPGLGQVYNGNYQSAAVSFVLNVLLAAAAVELYQHELRTPALAAGALFSVFYVGNIASSVQSSRSVNRARTAELELALWRSLFPELPVTPSR